MGLGGRKGSRERGTWKGGREAGKEGNGEEEGREGRGREKVRGQELAGKSEGGGFHLPLNIQQHIPYSYKTYHTGTLQWWRQCDPWFWRPQLQLML